MPIVIYTFFRWGKEVYKARKYKNNWTPEGLEEGIIILLMTEETINSDWKTYKGYITKVSA